MEMSSKVAVVTGGASGIGRAICYELVQQNVFVIISDINEMAGRNLEAELNNETIKARFVYLDVTKYDSVETLLTNIYTEFGRIDYL